MVMILYGWFLGEFVRLKPNGMDSSHLYRISIKVGSNQTKGIHTMNDDITITIDLAKNVFQVAVFNRSGNVLFNNVLNEKRMCKLIEKYPNARIYMEACGSSHYWGRYFQKREHFVGLLPAQIVAGFRMGNKSDKNDALAIYEASKSKNEQIHLVPILTLEQQDISMMHTYREGCKKQRNQIASRIRGIGLEYGVKFPLGINKLCEQINDVLEDGENELTVKGRELIDQLYSELKQVMKLFVQATKDIEVLAKENDACKRLTTVPGIAWLGASMMFAKFGNASHFKRGRDGSACLGLVPAHTGTGGTVRILGITKRGDTYLRSILVNGARAVVIHSKEKTDKLSCWIRDLLARKSFNTVVVAVANKMVRMATALLKSGEEYRQAVAQ